MVGCQRLDPKRMLPQDGDKEGASYSGGRTLDALKSFTADTLEVKCQVSDPKGCSEKETKFIDNMKVRKVRKPGSQRGESVSVRCHPLLSSLAILFLLSLPHPTLSTLVTTYRCLTLPPSSRRSPLPPAVQAKSAEDRKKELTRLSGMKSGSMKPARVSLSSRPPGSAPPVWPLPSLIVISPPFLTPRPLLVCVFRRGRAWVC